MSPEFLLTKWMRDAAKALTALAEDPKVSRLAAQEWDRLDAKLARLAPSADDANQPHSEVAA